MMKVLLILSATAAALCFMSESAKAQQPDLRGDARPPATNPPPASMFQTLRDLYASGALPDDADLIGWRSGRCYHFDQPWVPFNGLLTGWPTPGPDHGPIKPTHEILHTLPVYWVGGGPAIFDQMTPQLEDLVTQYVASQAPSVAPARYDATSVYGSYVNRFDQTWVLRKVPAANFNVADGFTVDQQGPVNRGGGQAPGPVPLPQKSGQGDDQNKQGKDDQQPPPPEDFYIVGQMSRMGQVIQYCYFFKEVHTSNEQQPGQPGGGQQQPDQPGQQQPGQDQGTSSAPPTPKYGKQ